MRIGLGIVTLTAGIASFSFWFAPSSVESGLSVVSDVGKGGVASLSSAPGLPGSRHPDQKTAEIGTTPRFFGSALPATPERSPVAHTQAQVQAQVTTPAAKTPSTTWTTDVAIYSGAREQGLDPSLSAPARVVATNGAGTPRSQPRQEIARALQAELKRVGCYAGEVDGEWGPGSRRSLRAFIEHANSGLSSDEPDLIHLTLVRGYSGAACRPLPGQPNGTITATRLQPPVPVPAIAPARSPFPPSAPAFASAPVSAPVSSPVSAPAPIVTGTIDAPASGALRPANFEGRMTVGAPLPADAGQSAQAPLGAAPAAPASQPRAQRPRHQQQSQQQAQRRERAWTGTFFNQ